MSPIFLGLCPPGRAEDVKCGHSQNNKPRRLRMQNEDNAQHLSNSNTKVIAAIRALEDRIINVEGIINARLNDTRPLDGEILARLNELNAGQFTIQERIGSLQERVGSLQEQFDNFRRETNDNFRLVNNKLDVMNDDVLTVRAKQRDLEKRVTLLEKNPIESAT